VTTLPGRGATITVIGDVMLDHFVVGRVDRISPEAPVPIVRFDREEHRIGGAANVAHNVSTLGGLCRLVGLVGSDAAASELRKGLIIAGISDRDLVEDGGRPTTRKMRIVTTRNQQVARIDQEDDGEPNPAVLERLLNQVAESSQNADAIVLSDYRKGVVAPAIITAISESAQRRRIPLLVDPKTPVAERYRGATLITPNHHEAELMTQTIIRSNDDARSAARRLHEQTNASVIITRGEHGMWVLDTSQGRLVEHELPAVAREVSDVTGAGDTVIAVLALALAGGATLADAAHLANVAAGLVVARFGPATLTRDELAKAAGLSPAS
jgi:D-beta-D-heptose 7-phosphate kinase/D-beta-D-heptose 1-phosphate adenosyltransferase